MPQTTKPLETWIVFGLKALLNRLAAPNRTKAFITADIGAGGVDNDVINTVRVDISRPRDRISKLIILLNILEVKPVPAIKRF
tara:strand:- start:202 stop:450 length:249 start_codon:yes stop_codon:yes gene_type:complete